jgi:hypothetical protein
VNEYAHRRKLDRPDSPIFWISGVSIESLQTGYSKIAREVASSSSSKDRRETSSDVETVLRWLQSAGNEGWLLILDNFDNITVDVNPFLPSGRGGSIIITTRDRRIIGSIANAGLHLEQMEHLDAEILFIRLMNSSKSSGIEIHELPEYPMVQQIIRELHGFPLAVTQAAAFVRENAPMTLAEYLKFLTPRSEDREMLLRFKEANPAYPESIMTTWELSFRHIEENHPRAKAVLELLGFLHHSNIEEELLTFATKPSVYEYGETSITIPPHLAVASELSYLRDNAGFRLSIGVLVAFSLISRTVKEGKGGILDVHPLVHEWIRIRLGSAPERQAKLSTAVALVLEHAFPFDMLIQRLDGSFSPLEWYLSRYNSVLPHIKANLLNLRDYLRFIDKVPASCITLLLGLSVARYVRLGIDAVHELDPTDLAMIRELLPGLMGQLPAEDGIIPRLVFYILDWTQNQTLDSNWLDTAKLLEELLEALTRAGALSVSEPAFLIVAVATMFLFCKLPLSFTQLKSLSWRSAEASDFQVNDQDLRRRDRLLILFRRSLERSLVRSDLRKTLKLYIEYRIASTITPATYWEQSDHLLTERVEFGGLCDLRFEEQVVFLNAMARILWAQPDQSSFLTSSFIIQRLVLVGKKEAEDHIAKEAERKIEAEATDWSSSYISSSFGRSETLPFALQPMSTEAISNLLGYSCQYFWSNVLVTLEAMSKAERSCLETGGEIVEVTEKMSGNALELCKMVQDFLQLLTPGCGKLFDHITVDDAKRSMVRIYQTWERHVEALDILMVLLDGRTIRNSIIAKEPKLTEPAAVTEEDITIIRRAAESVQRERAGQESNGSYTRSLAKPPGLQGTVVSSSSEEEIQSTNWYSSVVESIGQWLKPNSPSKGPDTGNPRSQNELAYASPAPYRLDEAEQWWAKILARAQQLNRSTVLPRTLHLRKEVQETLNLDSMLRDAYWVLFELGLMPDCEVILKQDIDALNASFVTSLEAFQWAMPARIYPMRRKSSLVSATKGRLSKLMGRLALISELEAIYLELVSWYIAAPL